MAQSNEFKAAVKIEDAVSRFDLNLDMIAHILVGKGTEFNLRLFRLFYKMCEVWANYYDSEAIAEHEDSYNMAVYCKRITDMVPPSFDD